MGLGRYMLVVDGIAPTCRDKYIQRLAAWSCNIRRRCR